MIKMTEEKSSTLREKMLGTHIQNAFQPQALDMFGRHDEKGLHEVCGNDLLQFLNCDNII